MGQPTSRLKATYALFGLVTLGVLLFVLHGSRRDSPIRFGSTTHSTVNPWHSVFGLTNTTARQILYRVSNLQFKCNGVWSEFDLPAEFVWMGAGQPLLPIPHKTLAARSSNTVAIERPMHITAPVGATAWRIGVVWSYASPTQCEQLRNQVLGFITRRSTLYDRITYTNLSPEVKL